MDDGVWRLIHESGKTGEGDETQQTTTQQLGFHVVIDDKCLGCILQCRAFMSLNDLGNSTPYQTIILLLSKAKSVQPNQAQIAGVPKTGAMGSTVGCNRRITARFKFEMERANHLLSKIPRR